MLALALFIVGVLLVGWIEYKVSTRAARRSMARPILTREEWLRLARKR